MLDRAGVQSRRSRRSRVWQRKAQEEGVAGRRQAHTQRGGIRVRLARDACAAQPCRVQRGGLGRVSISSVLPRFEEL